MYKTPTQSIKIIANDCDEAEANVKIYEETFYCRSR